MKTHTRAHALPLLGLLLMATLSYAAEPQFQHGIAMHGEPKYSPDFTHFAYVNPDAPKGGTLRQDAVGSFDTFNGFNIKGTPAQGLGLLFEALTIASADEPFTRYGLIAEGIYMPEDRKSVEFTLRPEARFHDGSPITADDVIFSFNILKSEGTPLYRFYYRDVIGVEKINDHHVRFTFRPDQVNMELPLIVSELPILSKAYWQERDFSKSTLEAPVGSGPYQIDRFEQGRYIVYRRDPNYWGKELAVSQGLYNFDEIQYDYYRDRTVSLEAFKAGDFDWRFENRAKDWALAYDIPVVEQGYLIKKAFPHQRVAGMQGFVFNTRRPMFQDSRVRRALGYAFDFEWSNKNLFFGQYTRTDSYFDNSELSSSGLPSPAELAILEPLRDQLPPEVFTASYTPPSFEDNRARRQNLRHAVALLQEAGWTFEERRLVHSETKAPFEFEILLFQPTFEPVALPFVDNLKRLGVNASVRVVDSAQYVNRLRDFNFDMVVGSFGQSASPGNEQRNYWGSEAADRPGSNNLAGIKDPAIDELIELIISAPDRPSLITRVRALDRVLLWNHYVIPHFHIPYDRVVYWDKFSYPDSEPRSGLGLLQESLWWYDADKAAQLPAQYR